MTDSSLFPSIYSYKELKIILPNVVLQVGNNDADL